MALRCSQKHCWLWQSTQAFLYVSDTCTSAILHENVTMTNPRQFCEGTFTSRWVLRNFGKIWQKMVGPKLWCMCRFQSFTFMFCSPRFVTGECAVLPIYSLYQSCRIHYETHGTKKLWVEASDYDRNLFLYGRHDRRPRLHSIMGLKLSKALKDVLA